MFAKAKHILKIFIRIKSFQRNILNIKRKRRRKENNSTETKDNGEFQEKTVKPKYSVVGISLFSLEVFQLNLFPQHK